jgi:fibronectin-binding autotransporter adhesin
MGEKMNNMRRGRPEVCYGRVGAAAEGVAIGILRKQGVFVRGALALTTGVLAVSNTGKADTYSKNNTAGALSAAGSWNTGVNGGTPPPGGSDIGLFNSSITAAQMDSVGAPYTIGELVEVNPGGLITIADASPNVLTINGVSNASGGVVGIDMSAATQNLTISAPLALGGAQAWNVASGRTLLVNDTSLTAGANLLTIAGAGNTTFGAANTAVGLSSTGGITKVGAGTLTIYGATTNPDSIGTSTLTVDGGITNLFAANSGTAAVLNSTANVAIGGGALLYTFPANSNNQVFNNLTLTSGESVVFANRSGSFNSLINFSGTITRNIGATLTARENDTSRQQTLFGSVAATPLVTSNGTAYVTLGDPSSGTVFDNFQNWAAVSATHQLLAATYTSTTATSLGTSVQNANVAAVATTTLAANATDASFRDNVNQATTIDLAGQTYQTGGILVTSTVATAGSSIKDSVGGGSLTGPAGSDLTLLISANAVTPVPFTISANIVDNVSGGVGTALTKGAPGTLILSGNNTFTNGLYINDGSVQLGSAGALNATTPNTVNFGGSGLVAGVANTVGGANGGTLNSAPTLSLGGNSTTIASVSSANDLSGLAPVVQNANATAATLTFNTTSATPSVFTGTIQNGTGGGALALVKNGTGTQTIGGTLTYTGNTTVNAGTLGVTSALSSPTITVGTAAGAGAGVTLNVMGAPNGTLALGAQTLAGTGTVTGSVTAGLGSVLSPGNGVGSVDPLAITSNLTLNNGSMSNFEFGPSSNDQLTVGGTLTLNGTDNIDLLQAGSTTNKFTTLGTYTLFTFGTGQSGGTPQSSFAVANPATGLTYTFADNGNLLQLMIGSTGQTVITSAWNVSGGGSYNTAANWNPQTVPNAVGATAIFGSAITAPSTVTIDAPVTVGEIDFNNANAYTLSGTNAITFDNSGNVGVVSDALGSHFIAAPVTLVAGLNASVTNATDTLTVSGAIGGTGPLTKAGAGILALTGTNTYTGGTNISNGVVQINGPASLGDIGGTANLISTVSPVTLEALNGFTTTRNFTLAGTNNTIQVDGATSTYEIDGTLTDGGSAGSLIKTGAGTLTLEGGNTYTGTTTISAGTLALGNGATAGTGYVAGPIVDNAALSLSRPDTYTLGNLISGTGTVTQVGTGNTTLSAANTFTGNTVVAAGVLTLGNALAIQDSTLNYNNQGGTLSFGTLTAATFAGLTGSQNLALTNAAATPAAVALTIGNNNVTSVYTGTLGGLGSLLKVGTGAFNVGSGTVAGAGGAAYTGTTTVEGGTLVLGGNSSISNGGVIDVSSSNATAGVNAALTVTDNANVNSTGTLLLASDDTENGNNTPGTGTLLVNGSGTLTTTGFVFGGGKNGTRVPAGNSVTVSGNGTFNVYGTFDFEHTEGSTASNNQVNLNGGTLAVQNFIMTGGGTAGQNATLHLNGGVLEALDPDGANGGTVFLPALTTGTSGALTVDVDSGGAKVNTNSFNVTIAATLLHGTGTPDGGLTVSDSTGTTGSSLTLTGTETYTGPTTVNSGTLVLSSGTSNNITASSKVVVNGTGTLNVASLASGTFAINSGQVLAGSGGTVSGGIVSVGSGANISGGSGVMAADTLGVLHTGQQTWTGGTYTVKLDGAQATAEPAGSGLSTSNPVTAGAVPNDELVISGLAASSGLTINPVLENSTSFATANYSYVIVNDTASSTPSSPTLFDNLALTSISYPAGYSLSTASTGGNDEELILDFNSVAAPEPTSLLLAGIAAAPLALGRRRRRRTV